MAALWKRFDDISGSNLHARVSLEANGFWSLLLGIADTRGRFPADPARLRAIFNKRRDLRLPQIVRLTSELACGGLIHVYSDPARTQDGHLGDAVGEQYGLIHDFRKHVPPGALRYISPTFPAPPETLCVCLFVSSPSSSSPSPASEARPTTPRPRRPSPSPSSLGKEGSGEKTPSRGIYGVDPALRRRPPRPDCPNCKGGGYRQLSMAVGNATAEVTVSCECREGKTA